MDERQISIRQLSRLTGITYTTIRAVYHGERRSVQLEVLEAICRVLNVQPGDIYQIEIGGTVADRSVLLEPVESEAIEQLARPVAEKHRREDWQNW